MGNNPDGANTVDLLESGGVDYEQALSLTGFGWFHYRLLALCGLIYANTAIGVTIISFVLPSATCVFQMTSEDKGWLTAAPMLGMVIGSYFWGCLADTKGRRVVLIVALLLDGIIGILSTASQKFPLFMFLRFINGFAITGAMGICFPYLGEFQPTAYREKILCWMELFWTLGIIVLPCIAWLVIPLDFRFESPSGFLFGSWNLFVALSAIPSLLLGLWLFYFPESPKFLIECGEEELAIEILKDMYHINTGGVRDDYPITGLKEREKGNAIMETHKRSIRTFSMHKPKHMKILLGEIWEQTKALCGPQFRRNTVLACMIQFGITTSYYTLMIWFPELFGRFEEYEKRNPNASVSVCDVSSVVLENVNGTLVDDFCGTEIDTKVYWHTLLLGFACIPTSFWLPLCVHRLGAKFFLIFSLMVAGAVTVGLSYVHNSTQNLLLSCIFEALTSMGISTVYCVMVDLFPTNLRVMAAALSLTCGRGGALLGNILFGFLVDLNCSIPVVLFSAMLFGSAILCFFLPNTGSKALE
ncbi:synaptic vesicle glycoprotein 2B-like [Anopheles cruzii]|uniref:synaptic vesicle glycoprotein 2B-like n=1 Tax=Anopheles cruzii TaxID=68878 RepID=UPI0022EC667A|nr:synaptic vesicle glycoprotein 2B-like [Anopheles cruzii]XP_052868515.1 synaptic vesicle glycoprotein 2B-like [Anopheles cruzii]XP_052868523.1 synaptic vesicle glycoprotein 2B-like [Anopheles cruzii]XP_052868532.1 synaptic vesicle glycoprotein 2B-like [Anopheles cruzii]XP_052868541.1 synaptic vesicle glycoprotein 2B-like [Anopheles cruzii]